MKKQGLTRRRFLAATLSLGAGATLYILAEKSDFTRRKVTVLRSSQIFADPAGVMDVGHEYLRLYPEEKDVSRLTRVLLSGSSDEPISAVDLRNFLWEKIRQDYENDNVVSIHQWLLSRTEGRLLALAALGS